jgi:hypothetical protein
MSEERALFVWQRGIAGTICAIVWDNGLANQHSSTSKEFAVNVLTEEQSKMSLWQLAELFPPPQLEE